METKKLMWLKNANVRGQIKDPYALKKIPFKNRWDHPGERAALPALSIYGLINKTFLPDHVPVAQLCPTLCDPMDCSPVSSVHGDSPGKNIGVGCLALLQGDGS